MQGKSGVRELQGVNPKFGSFFELRHPKRIIAIIPIFTVDLGSVRLRGTGFSSKWDHSIAHTNKSPIFSCLLRLEISSQ